MGRVVTLAPEAMEEVPLDQEAMEEVTLDQEAMEEEALAPEAMEVIADQATNPKEAQVEVSQHSSPSICHGTNIFSYRRTQGQAHGHGREQIRWWWWWQQQPRWQQLLATPGWLRAQSDGIDPYKGILTGDC